MRFSLFLLLMFTAIRGHSQTVITVMDDLGEPLPFAHVVYSGVAGAASGMAITGDSGTAIIPETFTRQHPVFSIEITYIGFYKITDTLPAGAKKSYRMQPSAVALNGMIVTAQYAPNSPEKAVHKVKIIDRKKIDAQGAITLRDVLQNELNVRISQDNVLGSSLSIQGISGQNVKILMDGVPITGRLNGNIDLSQINLNNVERIEIVEGPLSVNYGTDALAGTINIITKKGSRSGLSAGANTYYETAGQYNADARIGWSKTNYGFDFSGGRNYFDGWSPNDPQLQFPEKRLADSSRVREWNPKEQHFVQGRFRYKLKKFSFSPFGDIFTETITNRGAPRKPYRETAFDDYYNTRRANGGLQLSGKIGRHKNINVLASHNNFRRIKNTYFKDLTNLEQELSPNPDDQDTSQFINWMSRGSFTTSADSVKVNFEAGYDLNLETARGKRTGREKQEMLDAALFASAEYRPIEPLTFRPGLRYAYNSTYNAPLVPSINVRYKWRKSTFRASYARGFRAPSLKELYFEFVDVNHNILGNAALNAEESDNLQLNIVWQQVKGQRILKLESGGFWNDIRNLITLAQNGSGTEFTYINIGRFRTFGAQAGAELMTRHLKLSAGASYTGRSNGISATENVPDFSYSGEIRGSMLYHFAKIRTNVAAFYKYTGALPGFAMDDEGDILQTRIGSYHLMDLTASRTFWNKRLTWTLGAKNLLDVQDIATTGTSAGVHSTASGNVPVSWGRSFFTAVKFDLNFFSTSHEK
ncbi:MAG: TonB-dependent receptor [Bacteroidia bacterium]